MFGRKAIPSANHYLLWVYWCGGGVIETTSIMQRNDGRGVRNINPSVHVPFNLKIIFKCLLTHYSSFLLCLSTWQNLSFGKIRSCLQPGGLSSSIHSEEICNPPWDQQPHFDWDWPQCLHRGNQGSEKATDGWGMKFKFHTKIILLWKEWEAVILAKEESAFWTSIY